MKHVKPFEQFISESNIDSVSVRIDGLPKGSMFEDSKKINNIFTKSKYSWSEVIENFERNQTNAKTKTISIRDIKITQPNI